jgi:PIN domain nuclease of toxin-antitoxin system
MSSQSALRKTISSWSAGRCWPGCAKAATRDIDTDGLGEEVDALGVRVMAFDRDAAEETARLWPLTTDAGLSLAERACLALAAALGATAVTTDRAWAHINVGVSVQVIR